ncbi:hypothetical protein THIX_110183 [Thiomonas sp. X19]|nr:hypothetical protein THIX_110183 [Thiomonas sp. X19]
MTNAQRNSARVPMYFVFGAKDEISDVTAFNDLLRNGSAIHEAAHKQALIYLNRLSDPESAEFHHPPWL